MNKRVRGLMVLGVVIFIAVFICGWLPFFALPNAGMGVALPVIEVPGEVVVEDFFLGVDLTNTIIGTVLADIVLVLIVIAARLTSNGWNKQVPGRFQALVEIFVEGFYNFCKGIAGDRLRAAPLLWPLVATIFFFLLMANWVKLVPGVETIGTMHCSHVGISGYPLASSESSLYVQGVFNAGTPQTEDTEHDCDHYFHNEWERYEVAGVSAIESELAEAEAEFVTAEAELAVLVPETEGDAEVEEEGGHGEEAAHDEDPEVAEAREHLDEARRAVQRQEIRIVAASMLPVVEENLEVAEAQLAVLEASHDDSGDHGEEAETEEGEAVAYVAISAELAEIAESHEIEDENFADLLGDLESAEADLVAAEDAEMTEDAYKEIDSALDGLRNFALTQQQYPTASFVFNEDQLDSGAAPFIFHLTPFVRGAATDLSLAFALAIMSIVAVQIYGVIALGPAYFEKFINISALGNLGKKPLGAIDFVVGLIEIISEIGKIVSLAFRLFGNLFAGGVALMAFTFLVALLIPGVMLSLEIIIGAVQALVFAVLTLVFSVQAMEHHGDHEEEHH